MTNPFRKTTQFLAPAESPDAGDGYNIYPAYPLAAGCIESGFDALARRLASRERIILDGMGGVFWEDFRANLASAFAKLGANYEWLDASQALKPEAEIDRILAPFLGGSDPLFGTRNTRPLADFFAPEKLGSADGNQRLIVYGTGAALICPNGYLAWVDVPKNEIQFRARAGSICNLGASRAGDAKAMYKRFYFAEWPPLRAHQAALLPRVQLFIDSQRPNEPAFMSGDNFRGGLSQAGRSWVRARPWFEPGPWGGQWLKRRFPGLPAEAPNLAWSFELISPENGLAFESGGRLLEASFDFLMAQESESLLGDFAARFGREFPIRFDYLDTFEGGNLSLQCHPRPEMAWGDFGERFTQDETYYLTDCAPDARVYLGFQAGVDPAAFERAARESYRSNQPLDVERFVQTHPSQKHGLYLIPNGTIHCSGRDNLVLEISATPYIFTFKIYDWMRMDLDGRPRPLNIDRAMASLYFDRQGERVRREFVARPRTVDRGRGWELVHLPTHAGHFYDVHRFEISTAAEARTEGSPHVLNLVEGAGVILEIPGFAPKRFAFGETFIVPAAGEKYTLRREGGRPVKVVKAFLKPSARRGP